MIIFSPFFLRMDNPCTASANLTFVKYSLRDCVKARFIIDMMDIMMKVKPFDPEIDVSAGTPIIRSMETAIERSRASILFISKNFFKCKLCNFVLDDLLSRHILTKGKYRIILIALDNCKIPHSLKKLNCIYCCKYENNMKKYRMALQDCFLQFMRRMQKALKGMFIKLWIIDYLGILFKYNRLIYISCCKSPESLVWPVVWPIAMGCCPSSSVTCFSKKLQGKSYQICNMTCSGRRQEIVNFITPILLGHTFFKKFKFGSFLKKSSSPLLNIDQTHWVRIDKLKAKGLP